MDFPAVAQATSRTGLPIYYRGEGQEHWSGLYHPPLYIYSLAGWFKIFGYGIPQARMFGATCALLQGWVIVSILQILFSKATIRPLEPFFWLIFLLNPYTVQTAAIPDIDSTIYGPLLGFVIYSVLRLCWQDGQWRTVAPRPVEIGSIGLILMVTFWAKLTTVWLLLPAIFLLLIVRFPMRRTMTVTLTISLIGIGTFVLTYLAYGWLTHQDVSSTFGFLLKSLSKGHTGSTLRAKLSGYKTNFFIMVPFMVGWIGLLPGAAAGFALLTLGQQAISTKDRRLFHYIVILSMAIASSAFYCLQQTTFGAAPFKYVYAYWGLMVTPLTLPFCPTWKGPPGFNTDKTENRSSQSSGKFGLLLAGLFVLGASYGINSLRDRIIGMGMKFFPILSLAFLLPIIVAVPGLLPSLIPRRLRTSNFSKKALAAAVMIYCGMQCGIVLYQTRAHYSTTYDYGQTGMPETILYIRQNTQPGDVIASMKDVGFQAGRRYYETYYAILDIADSRQRFIEAIATHKIKLAVFTVAHGQDSLSFNPKLKQWMEEHGAIVASFGDYRIYEIANDSSFEKPFLGVSLAKS